MASVTFDPAVGGDGSTVTDDTNPTTGLAAGGHRTRFVPALAQIVAVAQTVVAAAVAALGYRDAAAASAATAVGASGTAAGFTATSTTSLTVGTGSRSLTIQTGKQYTVGVPVSIISTANGANAMFGTVTSYNGGTGALVVSVASITGSGTVASWNVSICGPRGALGGPAAWLDKSAAFTAAVDDKLTCNTAGGAFAITLPTAPVDGAEVQIQDVRNTFATNNLTVQRGGATDVILIGAATTDTSVLLDVSGRYSFVYDSTLVAWQVYKVAKGVQ